MRPFHGHDEEDAKRFHQQILMALDGEMLSVSSGINYTMGDVARGDDGFRTSAQPAEDALAWFVANECGDVVDVDVVDVVDAGQTHTGDADM